MTSESSNYCPPTVTLKQLHITNEFLNFLPPGKVTEVSVEYEDEKVTGIGRQVKHQKLSNINGYHASVRLNRNCRSRTCSKEVTVVLASGPADPGLKVVVETKPTEIVKER